jgi:biopolymer transport protein ExbD
MPFLRRGFLKSANRPNNLHCRIDSVPYLGFTLVLLCAFMTSQPMITHPRAIDLFASTDARPEPAAIKWDSIHISVYRDGDVYFGNRRVDANELPNRIRDAILNGAEKKIYLAVDARARYSDVEAVLAQIQLAGLEKVCFLVEKKIVNL